MSPPLPRAEIDEIVDAAGTDLRALAGARLLVTGGTGFVGGWLTAALLRADDRLALGLRLVLLTRTPAVLPARLRGHPAVEVLRGDVRALPPVGTVDLAVHGAASSSAALGVGDGEPRAMAATIVRGTEAVLGAAGSARVLFLSSGAVYGRCAAPVAEDVASAPDPMDPATAYAQAKRLAETLCAAATGAGGSVVVARLFAFLGPGLPLGAHFAAGNIVRDVLAGGPVVVTGDGTAVRSYLYAADLAQWLLALLVRGTPGRAYNVGSPHPVTVGALARTAAGLSRPALAVRVLQAPREGAAPHVYVPVVERAARELGLTVRTPLPLALSRTLAWHRTRSPVAG